MQDLWPTVLSKTIRAWSNVWTREAQRQILRSVCCRFEALLPKERSTFGLHSMRKEADQRGDRGERGDRGSRLVHALVTMGNTDRLMSWYFGPHLCCERLGDNLLCTGMSRSAMAKTDLILSTAVRKNNVEWVKRIINWGHRPLATWIHHRGLLVGCWSWVCQTLGCSQQPAVLRSWNYAYLEDALWGGRLQCLKALVAAMDPLVVVEAPLISRLVATPTLSWGRSRRFLKAALVRGEEICQCLDWFSTFARYPLASALGTVMRAWLSPTSVAAERIAGVVYENASNVTFMRMVGFVVGVTNDEVLRTLLGETEPVSKVVWLEVLASVIDGSIESGNVASVHWLMQTFATQDGLDQELRARSHCMWRRDLVDHYRLLHSVASKSPIRACPEWSCFRRPLHVFGGDSVPRSPAMVDAILECGCVDAETLLQFMLHKGAPLHAMQRCMSRVHCDRSLDPWKCCRKVERAAFMHQEVRPFTHGPGACTCMVKPRAYEDWLPEIDAFASVSQDDIGKVSRICAWGEAWRAVEHCQMRMKQLGMQPDNEANDHAMQSFAKWKAVGSPPWQYDTKSWL